MSHHTLSMSPHYLVKYECQKTSSNLKYVLLLMHVNDKVVAFPTCVHLALFLALSLSPLFPHGVTIVC